MEFSHWISIFCCPLIIKMKSSVLFPLKADPLSRIVTICAKEVVAPQFRSNSEATFFPSGEMYSPNTTLPHSGPMQPAAIKQTKPTSSLRMFALPVLRLSLLLHTLAVIRTISNLLLIIWIITIRRSSTPWIHLCSWSAPFGPRCAGCLLSPSRFTLKPFF